MSRKAVVVLGIFLALLVLWMQREEARGTFDVIEERFVAWLSANAGPRAPLPPLTLVLYDDEASNLAGADRMGMLDAALFTRAASLLGAVAAAVEGVEGNPQRMIESADGMPVFGGYAPDAPPSAGWTPLRGRPDAGWPEVAGLVGTPGVFARGFMAPPSGSAGPREMLLVGRNVDRPVPSLLVLAWAASQGWRSRDLSVSDGAVFGPKDRLMVGTTGAVRFFPVGPASKMTMNDLLVASEKFERTGGASPVRGHVLVLARATADVARLAREGASPVTPAELWAQAWEVLRRGRLFAAPGWWFAPCLWAASCVLCFGPARRSPRRAMIAWLLAIMVYLLAALGAFSGARIFLPLAPALVAFSISVVAGRAGYRAGWLGQ